MLRRGSDGGRVTVGKEEKWGDAFGAGGGGNGGAPLLPSSNLGPAAQGPLVLSVVSRQFGFKLRAVGKQ